MKEIDQLIDNLKKSQEKCPWSKDRTIEEHLIELRKEVEEAINHQDHHHLKEELGDILMDLLFLGLIAEKKKLFTIQEMTKYVDDKLKRRKPWVFGDEVVTTKEEAVKRWNEIKQQEKSNG